MANNAVVLAKRLGELLQLNGLRITTAESCTGGLIASAITSVAGSSDWFDRAYITYSNLAKQDMLGVETVTLDQHGAVSQPVVEAMVAGALVRANADLAVAVSGVAGPDGGSKEKPVGTVWIAWLRKSQAPVAKQFLFKGDRQAVREQAVEEALQGCLSLC